MADTAIFDVDGTLVDTNYQHTLAWYRAFRRHDLTLPLWRLHRAIGMGGDKLVAAVAGDDVEKSIGDDLRTAWEREFEAMIDEIRPFDGVRELLTEVKDRGFTLVLASSGKGKHVEHFLDLFGGRSLADGWTTSEDAEQSKPAPDLVQVALEKAGGTRGVMVGDSTWDVIAAGKAGIETVAVRTGGFSEQELREAGAVSTHDSLVDLRRNLDETPLGRAD
ncbi:HAD family hydrolase [Kineosporia mesophila]|uniref:HAD family hydrolase n=1 Tax=Kineosporia mesophila TaxID=566012 RepID=A0ABP6Z2S7_9ACTN|nr:HAD family hydrolase [Kineosporia mesophila]MCD5351086.1 HAD family hydrolase [Kineosporia mesophila]